MPKRPAKFVEIVAEIQEHLLEVLPDLTRNQGRCTTTIHLKRMFRRRGLEGYIPSALRRLEEKRLVRVSWESDGVTGIVFWGGEDGRAAGKEGAGGSGATDGEVAPGSAGLAGDGEGAVRGVPEAAAGAHTPQEGGLDGPGAGASEGKAE